MHNREEIGRVRERVSGGRGRGAGVGREGSSGWGQGRVGGGRENSCGCFYKMGDAGPCSLAIYYFLCLHCGTRDAALQAKRRTYRYPLYSEGKPHPTPLPLIFPPPPPPLPF